MNTNIAELKKENEKLKAVNKKLIIDQLNVKDVCVRMAKNLIDKGKEEMGYHILAQIGETNVFACGSPYDDYISKEKIYKKIHKLEEEREYADDDIRHELDFKIEILMELLGYKIVKK